MFLPLQLVLFDFAFGSLWARCPRGNTLTQVTSEVVDFEYNVAPPTEQGLLDKE